MLKAKELRDQSVEELEAILKDARKELYTIRNESKQTKKLEQPHLIREKRKDIAKLLTVLCEKQNLPAE